MRNSTDRIDPIRLSSPRAGGEVFTKLMKIPGVQMIYVSALACTRHRNIDFIRMQRAGRLSFLLFSEVDMVTGDYITKTKDAAAEIAAERQPTGIILLTGCQSALLSTDYKLLSQEIEQEIGVPVRVHDGCRLCGFDEEKGGSSAADQLLYAFLRPDARSEAPSVNILGSAEPDPDSELFSILKAAGVQTVNWLSGCKTFAQYQQMARAHLNILASPQDLPIAEQLQESLGIPWVCLGGIYSCADLAASYQKLGELLSCSVDFAPAQERSAKKLQEVRQLLGARSIAVHGDGEIAKWLLQEGFLVESLLLNPHQGLTPQLRAWFEKNAENCRIELAGRGGAGKPGGDHGPGAPRSGGGRPGAPRPDQSAGPLKLGFAGSIAVLEALEQGMGGASR